MSLAGTQEQTQDDQKPKRVCVPLFGAPTNAVRSQQWTREERKKLSAALLTVCTELHAAPWPHSFQTLMEDKRAFTPPESHRCLAKWSCLVEASIDPGWGPLTYCILQGISVLVRKPHLQACRQQGPRIQMQKLELEKILCGAASSHF